MILNVLTELAACLCAQVQTDNPDLGDPCFCGVMPGQAALLDYTRDCSDGGVAWVRMVQGYPSTTVGQADQRLGNCGTGWGYDVEVGIVRSVAIEVEAPDEAESLATAEQQYKDMNTMRKAISCCSGLRSSDYILGPYTPYGPNGGVVGGSWTLYVGTV